MTGNDHGWTPLGTVADGEAKGASVSFGALVDERVRCGCRRDLCQRRATQEDGLCDGCREVCQ